jgi:hypothetical protein
MAHRLFPLFTILTVVVLLQVACSVSTSSLPSPTASPQSSDTPAPGTSTPAATLTTPSSASTPIPNAPTATAVLQPSPTPLELLNVPIEGGDPSQKFYAVLVYPHYLPAATTSLWFRVYTHKPMQSKVDGEGIASVDFIFLDSEGSQVYEHQETTAGYCAFGGGEPDCVIWNFASSQDQWPDGTQITSGRYTLKVNITSKDNTDMFGETTFDILLPQQP